MRHRRLVLVRFLPLTMAIVALCSCGPSPARAAAGQQPAEEAAPSCENSCRGLGLEKVKAGDDHCGLVPRARKDEALEVACQLAEAHRQELQQHAEERAREKCADEFDRSACRCRTELRAWENVYTHVLSQRCWTECGWAALVECDRADADEGEPDDG